ncbi:MAG: UDP-N-acetylglucosamine 2-epimerase (non-hydrolyzing) [Candidatus Latescibacterota bacterium]|nr:MAG: UDP-N-acetylglucosamine 2-epimerase (non-hydrolyzing) [Candidatus Latescibacterota bacterium]
MKILNFVGARPNFVKVLPILQAIAAYNSEHGETDGKITEVLVHTGQHYDYQMSKVFFDQLGLKCPDHNLGVGSGRQGWQTAEILARAERVFLEEKPDVVIVYGDTNSTLAGALAAAKLPVPVAHIEAGLRSYNRKMPEEINRILTDRLSTYLFCPTSRAVENLAKEGMTTGVHLVGDVMYDALLHTVKIAEAKSRILANLKLEPNGYLLATVHRAENTDNPENLKNILTAFHQLEQLLVLPLHPRTRKRIIQLNLMGLLESNSNLKVVDPVSYLDMLVLEKNARRILTDSGGIQKEAYWLKVPCITLRRETEWPETVEAGWNRLVGTDKEKIVASVTEPLPELRSLSHSYGDGHSSEKILRILVETVPTEK